MGFRHFVNAVGEAPFFHRHAFLQISFEARAEQRFSTTHYRSEGRGQILSAEEKI